MLLEEETYPRTKDPRLEVAHGTDGIWSVAAIDGGGRAIVTDHLGDLNEHVISIPSVVAASSACSWWWWW